MTKTWLISVLLIPICHSLFAEEPLVVVTWNLKNYLLQNRYENGSFRFEYPKPEIEKQELRNSLALATPDLVLVQEIGSAGFLYELQRDLSLEGMHFPWLHFAGHSEDRSGLGLLSRVPLAEIIFHDPIPLPEENPESRIMSRGIQEIFLVSGNIHLRIFHLHLKSRYTTDPSDPSAVRQRKAEVAALHQFLQIRLNLYRHRNLLLLAGDFNALFDSEVLEPLARQWNPVPASDDQGQDWTYLHFKSGNRDKIDGFWIPASGPLPLTAGILSSSMEASDHRPVWLAIPR